MMKKGEMPPPLPKRVPNPRVRDDRALHEFFSNSDKMHRATLDDAYAAFSSTKWVPSVGRVNFGDQRT